MRKENLKDIYSLANCPVRNVLNRIGDKWSILIIDLLGSYGTLRFNELNHHIGSISQKMLTVTLKTLEADGLVARKIYPQIPPKVEYTLTEMGKSILPSVVMLKDWASENMPAILKSRAAYLNQRHLETENA
jgi:DNA-binding HxlR family transcriptional regulator